MATKKSFNVGEIVRLKSGGPDMTVKRLPSQTPSQNYDCQWFAGKKLESGLFAEDCLEAVAQTKTP